MSEDLVMAFTGFGLMCLVLFGMSQCHQAELDARVMEGCLERNTIQECKIAFEDD